jgi:4-hydroxybenzoate polyprenyltransferase
MLKNFLSLVKFSHTVFAMPFALTGFFIGITENGGMDWQKLALVVACMVFARNAAMGFNRWLDRDIDAANPRTRIREIPAGIISADSALIFVLINCFAFVSTTWFINTLCFVLSPVALLVVLGYSYTKRFTWLCHLVLGLGLALAPLGAYMAVTGRFALLPILYSGAVMFWVAGFDVIYALQDDAFDRENRLYSMPASFGRGKALRISEAMHLFTVFFMFSAAWQLRQQFPEMTSPLVWMATGLFFGLLLYQHLIVKTHDLSRVNMAFFTTNGVASLAYGSIVIFDLLTV